LAGRFEPLHPLITGITHFRRTYSAFLRWEHPVDGRQVKDEDEVWLETWRRLDTAFGVGLLELRLCPLWAETLSAPFCGSA
jgi:hypothetical protein